MKEIIREFAGREKRSAFLFAKQLKEQGMEGVKIRISYYSDRILTKTKKVSKFIVYQEIKKKRSENE